MDRSADDLVLTLVIRGQTRNRLDGHFERFLRGEISARGLDADDPELFDPAHVRLESSKLAERTVAAVVDRFEALARAGLEVGPRDPWQETVEEFLAEQIKATEAAYLADDRAGLDHFIAQSRDLIALSRGAARYI